MLQRHCLLRAEALCDGICAAEVFRGERFVDDCDFGRSERIAAVEVAAGKHGCTYGLKVFLADMIEIDERLLARRRLLSLHLDVGIPKPVRDRCHEGGTRTADTRRGAQAFEDVAKDMRSETWKANSRSMSRDTLAERNRFWSRPYQAIYLFSYA